ncbi:unnamed protein product [Paramecium pentaurelia]|uniref:Transmembrane protein n=1 Tax=Paramecium pentaurelia TaxID=43138 RepID=A0A8S1W8K6_9CILI|nr:unnamed protein product [Paramecium pentaurelia]
MKVKHSQKRNIDIRKLKIILNLIHFFFYLNAYYLQFNNNYVYIKRLLNKLLLIHIRYQVPLRKIINQYYLLVQKQIITRFIDSIKSKFIPYNLYLGILLLISFRNKLWGCKIPIVIYIQKLIIQFLKKNQNDAQFSRSQDDVIFNETTGDYNLDNLIVFFKLYLQSRYSSSIVNLMQQCFITQSEESHPFLTYNYVLNYQLHVDLRTFSFKLGEFFNQTLGGCVFYDTFNIILNMILNIKSQESNIIGLIEHTIIVQLLSQNWEENCKSGWKPGDEFSMIGNIGALCEECDLYNSRGSGSYSVTSAHSYRNLQYYYNDIYKSQDLITTLMSVSSTREMIEDFVKGISLKTFGFRVTIQEVLTAILIKVLISSNHFNYFYLLITSTSRISLSFQYC